MHAMRYLMIMVFGVLVLEGRTQNFSPMLGGSVRYYYNTQNDPHNFSEATSRIGAMAGVQIQRTGKDDPLFMVSLDYTAGSIHQSFSSLGGYESITAEQSFWLLGVSSYLYNSQYKSWSGGIGLRADVVLYEKSEGWNKLIIMGQYQRNEDIHISYPTVVQRFKIGPSVYLKKTLKLGEKHAIEPFLSSTFYLSDEVKYSNVKALTVGLGVVWVMR